MINKLILITVAVILWPLTLALGAIVATVAIVAAVRVIIEEDKEYV